MLSLSTAAPWALAGGIAGVLVLSASTVLRETAPTKNVLALVGSVILRLTVTAMISLLAYSFLRHSFLLGWSRGGIISGILGLAFAAYVVFSGIVLILIAARQLSTKHISHQ